MAIQHANRLLDWQENLTEDEMPPEWMWPLEDQLEDWFESVDRKRKERYGDDSTEDKSPLVQNELSRGRGRG